MTDIEDMLLGMTLVMLKKVHASFVERKKKPRHHNSNIRLLEVAIANIELMRVQK